MPSTSPFIEYNTTYEEGLYTILLTKKVYIHTYTEREKERERGRDREREYWDDVAL